MLEAAQQDATARSWLKWGPCFVQDKKARLDEVRQILLEMKEVDTWQVTATWTAPCSQPPWRNSCHAPASPCHMAACKARHTVSSKGRLISKDRQASLLPSDRGVGAAV